MTETEQTGMTAKTLRELLACLPADTPVHIDRDSFRGVLTVPRVQDAYFGNFSKVFVLEGDNQYVTAVDSESAGLDGEGQDTMAMTMAMNETWSNKVRWSEIDVWYRIDPLMNAGISDEEIAEGLLAGPYGHMFALVLKHVPDAYDNLHAIGDAEQSLILAFVRALDAVYRTRADWIIARYHLMQRILNGRWSAYSDKGVIAEFADFESVLAFVPYLDERPRYQTQNAARMNLLQEAMVFGGEVSLGPFTLSVEF